MNKQQTNTTTTIPPLTAFSRGLSEAVVGIGILVLVGWAFHLETLRSVFQGLPSMNPMSAVAFVCSGLALLSLHNRSRKVFRQVSAILAAVVVVIGAAKTAIFFGFDTGIDAALFSETISPTGTSTGIEPNSGIAFLFVGVALLFLHFEQRLLYRPAHFLALATITLALYSFVGYLFGVHRLSIEGQSTQMALNTSLAYILLSLGMIFSRPDRGLMSMPLIPKVTVAVISFGVSFFIIVSFAVFSNTVHNLQQTLASGVPTSEEQLLFVALRTTVGVMGVSTPLFIAIMASVLFLIRGFLKPVRDLTEHTRALARGDFSRRTDIRSHDELGILARAFNDMAGKLQNLYRNLEDKVQRRTAELAEKVSVISRQKDELQKSQTALQQALEGIRREKNLIAEERTKRGAMLASIAEGVTITDARGRIILLNVAAERMLGWKLQEVQGKRFIDVVPLVDERGRIIPLEKRHYYKSLDAGKQSFLPVVSKKLFYYMRKDKSIFPIAGSTAPIFHRGKIIGTIGVFSDITHEKDIDQAKSEFVSLASHQLQGPLAQINWYLELFKSGEAGRVTPKQTKYIQEVSEASHRMSRLVNALLNVSRLELGTFAVDPVPTDLHEVIRSVLQEYRNRILRRKLTIVHRKRGRIPKVRVDPNLMRIVFQNLIGNATKYTRMRGKVSIVVSRESQPGLKRPRSSRGMIQIAVVDSGIGIPEHEKPKIFTKLFRGETARGLEPQGTGLGLYIVKSILDHTNGKIWFTSQKNKGTSFFVQIPERGMKRKEGTRQLVRGA